MSQQAVVGFAAPDDGEELARAELYGLLARLFIAPPDAELLRQFGVAVTQAPVPGSFLEGPWEALVSAMRRTGLEDARAEYDALFLGVGKPEVLLYGSYHLSGFLNERPLAVLREDLKAIGLERATGIGETEDHVSCVFEVMRYLIAGDDASVCNLEQQRRFFRAHVQPWLDALCEMIERNPRAALYREVAAFTKAFVSVETQAFDLMS